MLRISLASLVLAAGLLLAVPQTASADTNKPGWMPVVVARGDLKQWIDSTPIVDRPNRPLHFYGNTVRRRYYRSNANVAVAPAATPAVAAPATVPAAPAVKGQSN